MRTLVLAATAVLLVGCGGGGDDAAPQARNGGEAVCAIDPLGILRVPCDPFGDAAEQCARITDSLEFATSECGALGLPFSGDDPDGGSTRPVGSAESSPLISAEAFDVEPNDSMSAASAASFPNPLVPEQSVGFVVNGTINNLTDGVDTYAFATTRSRTFVFQLCASRNSCNPLTLGGGLDVAIAYFSVLDQFGTVLLSSQGNTVKGNVQHLRLDAGVLYYVMVIAEDTVNEEQPYTLRVFEAITEPEPEVLQEPDPNAPILSAGEAMSLTTTLDWISPTMNVDGTPLADLAGYNVYFGNLSGIYTDFRVLDNPGLVTYILDLPSEGMWFIAITALNSLGTESELSNEVMIEILPEGPPGDPMEAP